MTDIVERAADVLERVAAANCADPATDDLTVHLAIELAEMQEKLRLANALVESAHRSAWLILRAVAQDGPVHVARSLLDNFDPRRAELVTWNDPATGAVIFQAVERAPLSSTEREVGK